MQGEAIRLGLHLSLGFTKESFISWITGDKETSHGSIGNVPKDVRFFSGAESEKDESFVFRAGHTGKKIGHAKVSRKSALGKMELLHNEMQTKLYDLLVLKHGKEAVGTEVPTGSGTLVDLVVKVGSAFDFYEIKTSTSVKACIREALPQLLEYAYWRGEKFKVGKLVVVGPTEITPQAKQYIDFLNKRFGLSLSYQSLSK